MSADRADSNGGAQRDTRKRSPRSTGSGVPGMAIPARTTARAMSVAMSTRCRGRRSANVARNGPPSSHGRCPIAKVSAESSGEDVRW
jgi:hypothetical protein